MGLYNFQPRFVPFILDGRKTHTIRAIRTHPDKPGNTLHLYTGLRTKKAKLLMRVPCVKVEEVVIYQPKRPIDGPKLSHLYTIIEIDGNVLDRTELEALAQRDGFNDFDDMMAFWNGRLPFLGHIIHWKK